MQSLRQRTNAREVAIAIPSYLGFQNEGAADRRSVGRP